MGGLLTDNAMHARVHEGCEGGKARPNQSVHSAHIDNFIMWIVNDAHFQNYIRSRETDQGPNTGYRDHPPERST
jgi:hypothetical protein